MSHVFVLDTDKRPLNPVHPGQARKLLTAGKAAVSRRYPFTIILKHTVPHAPILTQPLRVKIDPGSTTTGLAVVNDGTGQVVWAAEVTHKGQQVREKPLARRAVRSSRRQRHTRYRQPCFANRRKPEGWLPPSLVSRVQNLLTWVHHLRRLCPIEAISQELVCFDMQLLQTPEISGIEYQQGELAGYEVREYLLEKWGRKCAYCGAKDTPLEIEHIVPKTRGGSNRVSNLTLACHLCNGHKGVRTAEEFGHPEIQAETKRPLKNAAAVNASRWALLRRLQETGLPVEVGTGGRTKWNRAQQGLPKTHWLDAACVGARTPETLQIQSLVPLLIRAAGREARQMCRMDRFGFPCTSAKNTRRVQGFQTGDIIRAVVTSGAKIGVYTGRVAVRATGSFNIPTAQGPIQGIAAHSCRRVQRRDGYSYQKGGAALPRHALKARSS
jgi:5-methylcytosine-specific restriction endonuclease McrA